MFTPTGNSLEVKIEDDYSDITEYSYDDKLRPNITYTGNNFEVKTEPNSSETVEYEHEDMPRPDIHTKRNLKGRKTVQHTEKQYCCTVCEKRFIHKNNLTAHTK